MATIVKKGRKPKSYYENLKNNIDISLNNNITQNTVINNNDISNNLPKKEAVNQKVVK